MGCFGRRGHLSVVLVTCGTYGTCDTCEMAGQHRKHETEVRLLSGQSKANLELQIRTIAYVPLIMCDSEVIYHTCGA